MYVRDAVSSIDGVRVKKIAYFVRDQQVNSTWD